MLFPTTTVRGFDGTSFVESRLKSFPSNGSSVFPIRDSIEASASRSALSHNFNQSASRSIRVLELAVQGSDCVVELAEDHRRRLEVGVPPSLPIIKDDGLRGLAEGVQLLGSWDATQADGAVGPVDLEVLVAHEKLVASDYPGVEDPVLPQV